MSQSLAIAPKEKANRIATLLSSRTQRIQAMLPAHGFSAERFCAVAMTVVSKNPRLLDAGEGSLVGAILECARLGLSPDPMLGQAYLVPYRIKGQATAQLQIGYRGLLALAWRSGLIVRVGAEVVREGDAFVWQEGSDPFIKHTPASSVTAPVTHAYAVAKVRSGDMMQRVLTREVIDARRNRSRGSNDGPWVTDFDAMARKTALRDLCKLLPAETETAMHLHRAVTLDEAAEDGRQNLGVTTDAQSDEEYLSPDEPGSSGDDPQAGGK